MPMFAIFPAGSITPSEGVIQSAEGPVVFDSVAAGDYDVYKLVPYTGNPATATAEDTTPDAFSFTDATNAALSTVVESNTITPVGYDTATTISVTGGEYRIDAGTWTSSPGTISPTSTAQVRGTSSAANSTAVNVVLTIGGVSDTFSITTLAAAPSGSITYGASEGTAGSGPSSASGSGDTITLTYGPGTPTFANYLRFTVDVPFRLYIEDIPVSSHPTANSVLNLRNLDTGTNIEHPGRTIFNYNGPYTDIFPAGSPGSFYTSAQTLPEAGGVSYGNAVLPAGEYAIGQLDANTPTELTLTAKIVFE